MTLMAITCTTVVTISWFVDEILSKVLLSNTFLPSFEHGHKLYYTRRFNVPILNERGVSKRRPFIQR